MSYGFSHTRPCRNRRWLTIPFCLALLGSVDGRAAGGVSIGNGGDVVECVSTGPSAGTATAYSGFYALDYLMTLDASGLSSSVQVASWPESENRFKELLGRNYPELLKSFEKFTAELRNTSDWTRPRIWLSAPHGLVDVQDEQLRRTLPANCGQSRSSTAVVALIQAVIRNRTSEITQYEFDGQTLSALQAMPLQYSYLMVHEWLWDHSDNPQAIRWANQFLHSKQAASMAPEQFKQTLKAIGITSGFGGFWSVCGRTAEVRSALESFVGKACSRIEPADLDRVTQLEIANLVSTELSVYDLNGLSQLRSFRLRNGPIKAIPGEYFLAAPRLQSVAILQLQITAFDMELVRGLDELELIDLQMLPISSLPENWLKVPPPRLARVHLNDFPLTTLPDRFFELIGRKEIAIGFYKMRFNDPNRLRALAKDAGVKVDLPPR